MCKVWHPPACCCKPAVRPNRTVSRSVRTGLLTATNGKHVSTPPIPNGWSAGCVLSIRFGTISAGQHHGHALNQSLAIDLGLCISRLANAVDAAESCARLAVSA